MNLVALRPARLIVARRYVSAISASEAAKGVHNEPWGLCPDYCVF